jgi:hypothetical protein
MAFAGERPELEALHELEEVLHHLADELAAWRRRALTAESRVGEQQRAQDAGGGALLRLRELEEENSALAQRLETARTRLAELAGRLDFLEEQALITEPRSETAKS